MSSLPPLSLRGNGPFTVPEKPPPSPLSVGSLLFLQDLLYESTVSPHRDIGGQKVTRNGGPQFGACLILSEKFRESRRGTFWGSGGKLGEFPEARGESDSVPANLQKNVRKPNHHYFSKKYRNRPPICIAIRLQRIDAKLALTDAKPMLNQCQIDAQPPLSRRWMTPIARLSD